jgi:hypothetical protein
MAYIRVILLKIRQNNRANIFPIENHDKKTDNGCQNGIKVSRKQ